MYFKKWISVVFVVLVAAGLDARAQQPAQPMAQAAAEPGQGGPQAGPIRLDVTVEDKNGEPVTGLQKQDFTLLDNKAERPISSFRSVTAGQEPVHVMLLIDAVNTPFHEVAYERDGVDKFLKANGGKLPYPTTVGFVTDKGTQVENGFSTDGNRLSSTMAQFNSGLRQIHRGSEWGGLERLQISMTAMRQVAAVCGKLPGRKMVIWISPGWPLLSGPGVYLDDKQEKSLFADAVEFSAELRRADVTLYDVNPIGAGESLLRADYYEQYVPGVRAPDQMQIANLGLQVLSLQSGGLTFVSNSDVTGRIERSMKDAQSWYEITFNPAVGEKPNEYHSIQVKVDKPGVTARTRTGYYAQR